MTAVEAFFPSPDFLLSLESALNTVWLSFIFPISYLLKRYQAFNSSGIDSTIDLAASKTIDACSRLVASVNTSAPASLKRSSYKPMTAVNVDLPALRGIKTMTSVVILFS